MPKQYTCPVAGTTFTAVVAMAWLTLGVAAGGQQLPMQRFPAAQPIADVDDQELMRLAAAHGQPWLFFEPQEGQLRGYWHARVYLQPVAADPPVRRGRVLLFMARTPPGHEGAKTWQVSESAYAQVPVANTGRLAVEAKDLPFLESHRLPDADLLSLVAFVRSSPSAPGHNDQRGPAYRVDGEKPINSIRRGADDTIEVVVMNDRSSSWTLTVKRDGDTWVATRVRFSIA
jgi:hypothetical protein